LKWCHSRKPLATCVATGMLLIAALAASARPLWNHALLLFDLSPGFAHWIDNVESGSAVETALYRLMQLPGGQILFRRPPRESLAQLASLQSPQQTAALYSLRALEEEQDLDFSAAERDWKLWADQAADPVAAHLDLAGFYQRRLKPQDELAALAYVGNAPAAPQERFTADESQRSWQAWVRSLDVVDQFALSRSEAIRIYAAWITRYPHQKSLYARQLDFLLQGREFAAASDLLARYRTAFPHDAVFPVQAEARLAVARGSAADGLAVYDRAFQPLWPAQLVQSYFGLIISSHNERSFADQLRAHLAANPDDLRDAARLFYVSQQQGEVASARAVLADYRDRKDASGATWTVDELYTFARLSESTQDYAEAARYYYALAANRAAPDAEQKGLVGLTRILLAAPSQPLRVGEGNLALYSNIATMDRGPGYLNGILSLLLNTQDPEQQYATEDQQAAPYFHRARAAELLAEIDRSFPQEPERADLHASLMQAYAAYGENDALIREGTAFLATFPHARQRVQVALQVADAYARTQQTDKEFALYQSLLQELAAQAEGIPLGEPGTAYSRPVDGAPSAPESEPLADSTQSVRSAQYQQVLNRYLARLVSLHRLPDALNVLRGELDRNPQDPGLYSRLAEFLQQNALNARQEEVYQAAIHQFRDMTWYARLARFYLRQRRNVDYAALMRQVTGIFSGTDLEKFLAQAPAPDASLALQVNLYAHQRFPHDLRFVRNLIDEYSFFHRRDQVEALLWQNWSQAPDLRDQLFELLSRTGRLDSTLALLRQQTPEIAASNWTGLAARNPAAGQFWMDACLWQSHFEQAVGAADALAAAYPANIDLGERASSLYRSLAYFHPEDTGKAVAIEQHLLQVDPANLDRLARIGDIYADRGRFADAAPYWVRMGQVHPGSTDGYLQSATVFWDYYDYTDAIAELRKARQHLARPNLFGYQIGAIEESQGNLPAAVREYAASALSEDSSSQARGRLLTLAQRPALRTVIDDATAGLLQQPVPSAAALQLRVDILSVEHRDSDLQRELLRLIAQTSSFDTLDAITNAARSNSLSAVQQAALQRQIALTTDPVRNLQLRYQLVDLYQAHNSPAAAAEIDSIYHDNGRILGVVRSTVDYDWDHGRKPQAVAVLTQAAQAAYPELRRQFQLESARKLTDLGQYQQSRTLLEALLNQQPLDADAESALADNFARANDQAGLEAFYRARLDLVQKSPLDRTQKTERIAQLRRGIIAAASHLGNTSEAIDQYIELINAYPDDTALAQEASLFAVAHNARERLVGYYQKTIAASPRDPRWSLVLARLATAAEDYPLAIDAYSKTIRLRPERQDLYIAQADLDLRLDRLDDAIADDQKLYTLTYHDPQWMQKVAELRARQGRTADAVKALQTAWIEGNPPSAANSFAVARLLESWGLLDDARRFAEQGVQLAGSDLLVDSADQSGAALYARILARQRQFAEAFARLSRARQQAAVVTLASVVQQVVKQGPAAVTNEEWRRQRQAERTRLATQGFAQALSAMAGVARQYYTPEEKSQFAAWLQSTCASAPPEEIRDVSIPAARAAGLASLTAQFTWRLVQQSALMRSTELSAWIQLEQQRGQVDFAGAQLEKLAATLPSQQQPPVLQFAIDAYRKAGDDPAELRATRLLSTRTLLGGEARQRYYQLLLALDPQSLLGLAATDDDAVAYAVRHGSRELALAAVAARSTAGPPVWKNAYTGLAGLYLHDPSPQIGDAFSVALNSGATIGDRISHPLDRNQHLAGETWFYYGSRYGEFLDSNHDPCAIDYLESELEHTPESSAAYVHLAAYFSRTARPAAALIDDQHALDLKPNQPAVVDSMATIQWHQGQHAQALATWSKAVRLLAAEVDAKPVPATFWGDFTQIVANVSALGQYDTIRQPVDTILRDYIAHNGYFRTQPLIQAAYKANGSSVEWLLNMATAASDPESILHALLQGNWFLHDSNWIRPGQASTIRARIVQLEQQKAQAHPGIDADSLTQARIRWLSALVDEKKFSDARVALQQIPQPRRLASDVLPSVLAIAAADGTLNDLLAQWKQPGSSAPNPTDLRNAAATLDPQPRRTIMQFIYEQALANRQLTAPNFLGLAAIRLDTGDTPGAMQLLKRMTLVSDDMYADMDSAASLLHAHHLPAQEIEFLRPLAQSAPWNSSFKVRFAAAMLAANTQQPEALSTLSAVAADPQALYADRIAAAQALKGRGTSVSGSAELTLLSQSTCPSPPSASMPFFVAARQAAATCAATPVIREQLLRQALAIDPWNASLRLQYIWAAFDAHRDFRALVAAQSYIQSWSEYYPSYMQDHYTQEPEDYTPYSANSADEQAEGNSSPAALTPADTARLALLAVRAYEHHHDSQHASRIVQAALNTVHDPALRKPLVDEQQRVDVELARIRANDARAPIIHADLEQTRVVRPHLLPQTPASSSATPQAQSPAEEVQP